MAAVNSRSSLTTGVLRIDGMEPFLLVGPFPRVSTQDSTYSITLTVTLSNKLPECLLDVPPRIAVVREGTSRIEGCSDMVPCSTVSPQLRKARYATYVTFLKVPVRGSGPPTIIEPHHPVSLFRSSRHTARVRGMLSIALNSVSVVVTNA